VTRLEATAYHVSPGFEEVVRARLRGVTSERGPLFLAAGPPQLAGFVRNVWLEPVRFAIESINDAARRLRDVQRNWALVSTGEHRRAALIQEKLPHVAARPVRFPDPVPRAPLGAWTLLDRDTVLASAACTHPSPGGVLELVEDRSGPPSRAYLKLQEALTLSGRYPGPGDACLDAGASPGGWTWVLASLGARVLAVDRAPLDPSVAALPGVTFESASAFGLQPRDAGPFDWICSDVVCYPDRLLEWGRRWIESGRCANLVATIKFQGRDARAYDVLDRFAEIPGSRIEHLVHNKHELTWTWSRQDAESTGWRPAGVRAG